MLNLRQRFATWWVSLKAARLLTQEQMIRARDLKERQAIAYAFNHRYTAGERYDKSSDKEMQGDRGGFGSPIKEGHRWMCPDCNRLHAPLRFSMFTGLIYPRCCQYLEGNRYDSIGEGANLKRPLGWCGPEGLFRKKLAAGLETISSGPTTP